MKGNNKMKNKIKEIVIKIKLAIMVISFMVACILGLAGEMWPTTKFNLPYAMAALSGLVFVIIAKTL